MKKIWYLAKSFHFLTTFIKNVNTTNDGIIKTLKIFNTYIKQQRYSLTIIVSNNHHKSFYCFILSHKKLMTSFKYYLKECVCMNAQKI